MKSPAVLALSLAAAAHAQTIQLLGYPAGRNSSSAAAISADGLTVAGNSSRDYYFHNMNVGMPVGYRWTAATGWEFIGIDSLMYSISGDGATVIGQEFLALAGPGPGLPFYWRPPNTPQFLSPGAANAASFDGSVIVGARFNANGHADAYRWTSAGGYQLLGHFLASPAPDGSASGVSADGLTVTGSDGDAFNTPVYQGFVWTAEKGMRPLGLLPGSPSGPVYAGPISADGRFITGAARNAAGYQQGFLWTDGIGMLPLRLLPGFTASRPSGISADGSVVVGWMTGSNVAMGFIWDRALGMRDLRQVLMQNGAPNLTGWTLEPTGISADGSAISANVVGPGITGQAAIIHLPPFCYANCDGSTAAPKLNIADFTCFLNRFVAGDAYTNCDRSTAPPLLTVADFSCFLNHFFAACP